MMQEGGRGERNYKAQTLTGLTMSKLWISNE